MFNNVRRVVGLAWRKFQCAGRKRGSFLAADNHIDNKITIVHLKQIDCLEVRLELLGENWRIISRNSERNHGADVAENRIANRVAHLGNVLVGNGQIKAIFSSLRQNSRKRIGGEVLELVDVKIEWAAVADVRNVASRHGGKLDFCDQKRTEDGGIIFTDKTFGQIDN